jgi:hypothetical protein
MNHLSINELSSCRRGLFETAICAYAKMQDPFPAKYSDLFLCFRTQTLFICERVRAETQLNRRISQQLRYGRLLTLQ